MNSEQLSDLVVEALEDIKAKDIVKLDVRDMTTVTDYMVVASGTSTRHVQALVDNVIEKASELQDTLVHVMLPRVREFYNLEKLWSLRPAGDLAATER
jgi:ribosome-associated protein